MENNVNNGKSHEKYWRLRQEPKTNGGGTHIAVFHALILHLQQ
jgi:hypothetical protein